jgi:hypothetical protein
VRSPSSLPRRSPNVLLSYGHLFAKSLLRAACLAKIASVGPNVNIARPPDRLTDKVYNMRDNRTGLNVDFMSYALYAKVGYNSVALLEPEVLLRESQKVFTVFFQHFASRNVSPRTGGWTYQPIGSQLQVSPPVPDDWTPVYMPNKHNAPKFEDVPLSNTQREADATLSISIQILQINPIAFWISTTIMAWLLLTIVVFLLAQRTYLGGMMRNVECIADLLVLIAGSDRLLNLIKERGIEKLIEEDKVKTRFRWVQDSGGVMRWRLELIEDTEVEMQRLSLRTIRTPSLEGEEEVAGRSALPSEISPLGSRRG